MIDTKPGSIYRLQTRFKKVCRQLQTLLHTKGKISLQKIQSLQKRRDKYLQRLLSLGSPLLKSGGALAFIMFLSAQTEAQSCNRFLDANLANPFTKIYQNGYYYPVFVDIDGDGDLDCYITESSSYHTHEIFFKNTGTKYIPYYVQDDAAGGIKRNVMDVYSFQFADMDGDGDYDCFLLRSDPGYSVLYFENTGTKTKPNFVENEEKNPLSFISVPYYGIYLTVADIDGDGDYDAYSSDTYGNHVYKNIGTKTTPQFSEISYGSTIYDYRIYYDWNNDGLIDYLDYRGAYYYRNVGPKADDFNYVLDNVSGPKFGAAAGYMQTLVDINNDGVPEAFSLYNDMLTVTPVPVIQAITSGKKTRLTVLPRNKNYTYQWQRNGKDIDGATLGNLFVSLPGYYTAEIKDSCGTGFSLPYQLDTSAAMSHLKSSTIPFTKSANSALQFSLNAYPNPFTQQFSLDLGNTYSANTVVKISDVQGRTISTTKANSSIIQLGGNLQKGVYIVQVWQNNSLLFTRIILKE